MYVDCAKNGEPAPVQEIPAELKCDLSRYIGAGHTFDDATITNHLRPRIACKNSICWPVDDTGITNGCVYMCGNSSCP